MAPATPSSDRGLTARRIAGLCLGYLLVGGLSLTVLKTTIGSVLAFWLPCGLGLALQARASARQRPWLFAAQLLLEFLIETCFGTLSSHLVHFVYSALVAGESALAGALLRRLSRGPGLHGVREVGALAVASVGASAVFSMPAAAAEALLLDEQFSNAVLDWVTADAAGMVVLGPLALITLAGEWPRLRRGQWLGGGLLLLLTLGVVGGLFFSKVQPQSPLVPLAFAVFPLFVAAAMLFGTAGATVWSFALCLLVSGGTMLSRGPFSTTGTSDFHRQFLGQLFVLLLALSALVVGGLTNDGRAARRRLTKALGELRDSTSRLQAFFATAPDATAVFDHQGVLLAVNEAFGKIMQRVSGVRPAPGEHRGVIDARAPAEWGAACGPAWEAAARGERRVVLLPTQEGALQMTLAPVRDPDGALIGVSKQLHDVGAAERLQQRRARAERLESVGRLAGGVAHDFNNLLTVIIGHAGALRDEAKDAESARDAEEIEAAALRAAGLTRQLLQFARREVVEPRAVDLGERVRGMAGLLTRLVGEDVAVVTALDPEALAVLIDPGRLEQVLLNLVVNARDAMPQGGQVTIRSRPHTVSEAEGRERDLAPGPAVVLEVEDQGLGMTPEVLARIFEPFFTTKESGRGTGLGLATTDGIVRQAGGAIAVESAPGRGTTFRVLFPRHDGPVLKTVPAVSKLHRGGTETVLLVEDEAAIRSLAARHLRLAGYQVLEAARGDIAIAVARAHQGEIALLITDVVLPGGGGEAVAAALAVERPRMKVLYVSGYSESVLSRGTATAEFLPKPYKPEALLERARGVLDGPLAA